MKGLQQLLREKMFPKKEETPREEIVRLIHAIQDADNLKILDQPVFEEEVCCPMCHGKNGISFPIDAPNQDFRRMWFCQEKACDKKALASQVKPPPIPKRAIEWKDFCEKNNLGDEKHNITFEKIQQNQARLDYLLKFSKTPKGTILMYGSKGAGKSYAALGLCELFTRTSESCIYISAYDLKEEWAASYKDNYNGNILKHIKTVGILVIDDFATGYPNDKFMEFLMNLIDQRLQWSNRGTIITTNMKQNKQIAEVFGEALADRLRTGRVMEFNEESRRPNIDI